MQRVGPVMSIAIGLHGDWGAGKSSVLAMVEVAMQGRETVLCLRFNGWTFQGFEDEKVAMLQAIFSGIEKARLGSVVLKKKAVALLKRIDWLKVAKKAGGLGFTFAADLPSPDQISGLGKRADGFVCVVARPRPTSGADGRASARDRRARGCPRRKARVTLGLPLPGPCGRAWAAALIYQ